MAKRFRGAFNKGAKGKGSAPVSRAARSSSRGAPKRGGTRK